jgi:hypothetical protein
MTICAGHRATRGSTIPNRRSFAALPLRLNLPSDPDRESPLRRAERLPGKLRKATALPKPLVEPAYRSGLTGSCQSAARPCPGCGRFHVQFPGRLNLRESGTADRICFVRRGLVSEPFLGSPPKFVREPKAAAEH